MCESNNNAESIKLPLMSDLCTIHPAFLRAVVEKIRCKIKDTFPTKGE
jgi:hypothetical protein